MREYYKVNTAPNPLYLPVDIFAGRLRRLTAGSTGLHGRRHARDTGPE
jgi:hypothetical protein